MVIQRLREWSLACIATGAIGLGGCVVHRAELSSEELERRRERYFVDVNEYVASAQEKAMHRAEREYREFKEGRTNVRSSFDVLIISGGGDYGAFGAGFLAGWGDVVDPADVRPEFDVVTGVSTGALIAPFAFIGDDASYQQVTELYSEPPADWIRLRGLLFFLPGNASLMDNSGLKRDIQKNISKDVIERIAVGSREDRILGIGTTNLDLGIMRPWRLTLECERAAASGNYDRVHDILLASSAIPAAFPPVVIDDTLYVDGGTTSNILINADMRSPKSLVRLWRTAHADMPLPKVRYWVIINNQLGAAPQVVQPSWVSVTGASVSAAIRSSTIGSLRHLDAQVQLLREVDGVDVELRFVAIPEDWRAPKPGMFIKETMQSLVDLGRAMGRRPTSWHTQLRDTPGLRDQPFAQR